VKRKIYFVSLHNFFGDNINGKATANNPHPLTDATGSRRYICIQIPQGQYIDNVGEINYEQLYAQVLYELREQKAPYWFNNEEVARIQELNIEFAEKKDLAEILVACFRKPKEGEASRAMNCNQMLEVIQKEYPSLVKNRSTRIHLGMALKELGYMIGICRVHLKPTYTYCQLRQPSGFISHSMSFTKKMKLS
jgi:predicted P-loop ATPase